MMKKFLLLFIILPILTSCGTGGGGGSADGGAGSGNDKGASNKINPVCSQSGKVARIKVAEDGLYRITYLDLYNACVEFSGEDPAGMKMTNQGEEIAVEIADANTNGSFDGGDYIEFYGKAIHRDDGGFRFTETNIYWLSMDGSGGKRIENIKSDPQELQKASSFVKLLHMEEDTWYEQKNYPENDASAGAREHWFWGEVFYTPGIAGNETGYYRRGYDFNTRSIDRNQPVSLKLRLQSVNGSHHIKVYLNNRETAVIDQTWDSQEPFDIEVSVPAEYLYNGRNVFTLESVGGTSSGDFEIFYLDWFEVGYYHTYEAEHNVLEFTGNGQVTLSNFTSEDIYIYEISDHANIKKIVPLDIESVLLPGEYKATFATSQDTEGRFLAVTSGKKKTPPVIDAYLPADIKSKGADYVIITHEDFYDAIQPLAEYRGSRYNVLTVKVGDVYDEFGYGIETPQAIKDFLAYAYYNWPVKPAYVLLVGDATIDYKDISGNGEAYGVKSYVPAYLYNLHGFGEVPGDNWFVDVEGDILPEMHIGRIPAKSPGDVSAVVDKIIAHETSIDRSNNILLVADYDAVSGTLFEELSESIAGVIPDDYSVLRLYQNDHPDNLGAGIISEINSGQLIVNYTGHGAVADWTKDDAFTSEDVEALENTDYPFIIALNCLNGYFVLPDDGVERIEQDGVKRKQYSSIAEAFLLSPGRGAVAVWAASAIGYPSEHDPLAQALYKNVFNDGITLGEAVTGAKEDAYINEEIMEDVVQTFIFFGDPATRL